MNREIEDRKDNLVVKGATWTCPECRRVLSVDQMPCPYCSRKRR